MKSIITRYLKILLILIITLSSVPLANANTGGVTGGTGDAQPEVTTTIGLAANMADTIEKQITPILNNLGFFGSPVATQFSSEASKSDNSKMFSNIVLTQLQLYELLYVTGISAEIDGPVKLNTLASGSNLGTLKNYLTAYNGINKFLIEQTALLESQSGHNVNLLNALKSLILDMSTIQADTITAEQPLVVYAVRAKIQSELNTKTAVAISNFFMYLNDGKDSTNVEALEKKETLPATKEILTILKQWDKLPHISTATDAMKLLNIGNQNKEWLTALEKIVASMETDTGGVATDISQLSTNPELATSVLGKLGSSLFTVKRADNADSNKDKPLTNVNSWHIEDDKKNSDNEFDPGPAAKDQFLAMFAATSVYTPFVSKIGDRDYVEAYKALFGDTSEPIKDDDERVRFTGSALGPLDILGQVQNLKKPLYYFSDLNKIAPATIYGRSTEDVLGVAQLLTVGDLMNYVDQKKEMAAITIHGVMAKDNDAWTFYNYSLNSDGDVTTTGGTDDTNNDTANTVKVGDPIVNKVHADKEVNAGREATRIVFEMSYSQKNPGAPLLTGSLMHNIFTDTLLKSRIKERSAEAVYMDIMGNIVLNDGLVILPAAANPTFWAIPDKTLITQTWTYNPFTVAWMDTYPAIYASGSAPSAVNEKKDINKYLLSTRETVFGLMSSGVIVTKVKEGYKTAYTTSQSGYVYTDFKLDGQLERVTGIIKEIKTGSIGVDGKNDVAGNVWYKINEATPIQHKNLITNTGDSIFPYITTRISDSFAQETDNTQATSYRSAILIAKNMYAYITGNMDAENVPKAEGVSEGGASDGRLREGFLFNNVTMPMLTGITNATEFDKTNAKSDLLVAGGDVNVFSRWMVNIAKDLAVTSRNHSNILSFANADDISLLKFLYGALMEYGFYILFILLIFIIFIFLREIEFMAAIIKMFMISLLLVASLFIIPLAIPWITSKTSEPLTRDLVLTSMISKLEMKGAVNEPTPTGTSGVSVKLYNLSPKQAKELSGQFGVDGNYLTADYSINDQLGLFVNGTDMRMDLYSFFRFDPLIVGTSEDVNDAYAEVGIQPQIYHSDHSKSDYMSSNETLKNDMTYNKELLDYYTPYNLIENGLMKTLNTYLYYYAPPQSVVRYPDGLVKSSYIINTYMKSLAFLSAEPEIAELISSAETPEDYAQRGLDEAEVQIVNQKFYPYGDILGLQQFIALEFHELPPTYANSIWGQTMMSNGYYEPGTGYERRLDLANKVNRKAYDTILALSETKGMVSDETMIKLIALYSIFEFNKEISYLGNNVYPTTVSVNEISAADILSSVVLGNSRQFLFYDTSLVSNVYASKGFMGMVTISLSLIALLVYSILMSWIIPLVIMGTLFFSIWQILRNQSILPAMKFVSKVVGISLIMNLLLIAVLRTYEMHGILMLLGALLTFLVVIYLWLYYRLFFKKNRGAAGNSWQHRHVRGNGGYGYPQGYDQDGYGGYDRRQQEEQSQMQTYLKEEGGAFDRRTSSSDRYR